MWPLILRTLRIYAPYITLPFAALAGIIGYNIENILSDKYTPYQDSIKEKRVERLLSGEVAATGSLKEKKFVPETIFDKNLSPSLRPVKQET